MWKDISTNQPITKESILQRLDAWERELLRPGGASGISLLGISLKWVAGPKREGNNLQRGKTYGRIVYSDYNGKEIPRAIAIEEALKPHGLRQAEHDIKNMLICSICNAVAIGYDQRTHWERLYLNWARWSDKDTREVWIILCPKCLVEIAAGKIKRTRRQE